MKSFRPSPRYLSKLRLVISIVGLLLLLSGALIAWLVGLDSETEAADAWMIFIVLAVLDLIWWFPALLLAGAYYRSLSYEVQTDEVIVKAGILTKSVKHVPYRTVTNLTAKRDILDRWLFDLGTLNIQTAGMSGTTGAEESLVGLPNVQEIYEIVVTELRRFRGGMSPTIAEAEEEEGITSIEALRALLAEVRAIRETLEARR
jgi:membrane protein YdbS with pleckstrin-like domain